MQIFMSFFYDGQLKQQICYSFIQLISYMGFNPFKWRSSSFRQHKDGPNAFPPKQTGPWPRLQKGRKIPACFIPKT